MSNLNSDNLNLSDEKVIEALILLRYRFDKKQNMTNDDCSMAHAIGQGINEDEIVIYDLLDEYISKAKLTDIQLRLIKMMEHGYNYDEIAFELELKSATIRRRFGTACKRIADISLWEWRKEVFINQLNLKTKTCARCKDELPATHDFYSPDDSLPSGYKSSCKLCR